MATIKYSKNDKKYSVKMNCENCLLYIRNKPVIEYVDIDIDSMIIRYRINKSGFTVADSPQNREMIYELLNEIEPIIADIVEYDIEHNYGGIDLSNSCYGSIIDFVRGEYKISVIDGDLQVKSKTADMTMVAKVTDLRKNGHVIKISVNGFRYIKLNCYEFSLGALMDNLSPGSHIENIIKMLL